MRYLLRGVRIIGASRPCTFCKRQVEGGIILISDLITIFCGIFPCFPQRLITCNRDNERPITDIMLRSDISLLFFNLQDEEADLSAWFPVPQLLESIL